AAGACASGMRAALRHRGIDDVTVLAWAGDGGTYDIGLQSLSGAFERGDDILYVCYNNEMYSNTGIQRSGATPKHAWTTTTWSGKPQARKDMLSIVRAHRPPYLATASVGYPDDLYAKAMRAKGLRGPRYIEIISPCPPGWKFETDLTTTLGRLAVETGLWPLYEEVDGARRYTGISKQHFTGTREFKPVDEYLKKQGRFKHLFDPLEKTEVVDSIATEVRAWWDAARNTVG
ncbi:MAG TPA: thiamine pyrophosphate-dependent enzyme, partial [Thermoplasmata archaeon]|nr:thiamine pyrophosphate-dependent enzyme [Thermoplasmata archaeon]